MGNEKRLTDIAVKNAKTGTRLSDGGGLHLVVRPTGEKLWQYRFKLGGKENNRYEYLEERRQRGCPEFCVNGA